MHVTGFVCAVNTGSDHNFRFGTHHVHVSMRCKLSKSWGPNGIKHHRSFVSSGQSTASNLVAVGAKLLFLLSESAEYKMPRSESKHSCTIAFT